MYFTQLTILLNRIVTNVGIKKNLSKFFLRIFIVISIIYKKREGQLLLLNYFTIENIMIAAIQKNHRQHFKTE